MESREGCTEGFYCKIGNGMGIVTKGVRLTPQRERRPPPSRKLGRVKQPDQRLRLRTPELERKPTPAPPWVALLAAWLGLIMLVTSIAFIFLPGSVSPREELERQRQYSPADRFLPVPIYGIAVALFAGIVVLWQMRHEPRPLAAGLAAQRVQAWVGIVLALLGAVVIYGWVAVRGPG